VPAAYPCRPCLAHALAVHVDQLDGDGSRVLPAAGAQVCANVAIPSAGEARACGVTSSKASLFGPSQGRPGRPSRRRGWQETAKAKRLEPADFCLFLIAFTERVARFAHDFSGRKAWPGICLLGGGE
jgi:hypothetical protein